MARIEQVCGQEGLQDEKVVVSFAAPLFLRHFHFRSECLFQFLLLHPTPTHHHFSAYRAYVLPELVSASPLGSCNLTSTLEDVLSTPDHLTTGQLPI